MPRTRSYNKRTTPRGACTTCAQPCGTPRRKHNNAEDCLAARTVGPVRVLIIAITVLISAIRVLIIAIRVLIIAIRVLISAALYLID